MNTAFNREWFGQTVLHPLGILAILILGAAMLILPRRYAVWPMLIMACFVAPAQRVVVFTLNFDLLRIMVLFGVARIILKSEWREFRWVVLDAVMLCYAAYALTAFALLYGNAEAVKYKLGLLFDAMGMYFLFRVLIRQWRDFDEVARTLAVLSIPIAIAFLVENRTQHNPFAFLGGVPETTLMRGGRLRCQGAFAHPILAGCFWAGAIPLIACQWWRKAMPRVLVVLGLCMSLLTIVLCASSTPVSGVAVAMVGAMAYLLRRHLRWILGGLCAVLLMMHLSMNAPIWHLLARVDLAGGSTGWHRFHLVDQAIKHINEWWLIGSDLGTDHWGAQLFDVTNSYVVQGLHGGIGLLALFMLILVVGFRTAGRVSRMPALDPGCSVLAWAVGVCLFVHAASFIAVSYFGQIQMLWYLTLAMAGSLAEISARSAAGRTRALRPVAASQQHRRYVIARTVPHTRVS